MSTHEITGSGLTAVVKQDGAELCALRTASGHDVLWPGTPPWPRHAPVLFPIVGRLNGDALHHRGHTYRMTQLGFARDRRFDWAARDPHGCRLVLVDDAATRAIYPFAFRFEVAYAVTDDQLTVDFTITNTGDEILPACFGAHPAFRWPLREGVPKQAHQLEFATDEPAPIRRIDRGLLSPVRHPTPIQGRVLALNDALFAPDAIIMDQPASRSVRYSAPGSPVVEVSWDAGFPELGIWSRPDAALLCIEPWHGMTSPVDFDGEFTSKPGVMLIPQGQARSARHTIRVTEPTPSAA
jgi:galactose mutarotase-like enzyme